MGKGAAGPLKRAIALFLVTLVLWASPLGPRQTTGMSDTPISGTPADSGAKPTLTLAFPTAFDGLRFGFNGAFINPAVPPDVQVAVGPNHVMEMVNTLAETWTKAGSPVTTLDLHGFFGVSTGDTITDPKLLYDAPSQRWFASIADITSGVVILAASATNDPTGPWRAFSLPASTSCPDNPFLGISADKVTIAANDFSTCPSAGTFAGAQYWIVNKADLLTGANPRYSRLGPDKTTLGVSPVQSLSPTTTQYMVSVSTAPSNTLKLLTLTGTPPGSVTLSTLALSIRPTTAPPKAVQEGTSFTLDTGDGQALGSLWFRGRLWLSLDDACTPAGDTQPRSCLRLILVDTGNGTVKQDFDYSRAAAYYFYPALGIDASGDLVVTFGTSSVAGYPALMVASQLLGDPANTLQSPTVLRAGSAPYSTGCTSGVCRYGDYFGAASDPADPSLVWVAGEYAGASGWVTRIAAVGLTASLTVSYEVRGGGSGYGVPVLYYSYKGIARTAILNATPTTYALDPGTPWNVTDPLGGSSATERWYSPVSGGLAASAQTLRLVYSRQYPVLVQVEPAGAGAVFPPTGWFNASGTLNLTASPGFGWVFVGWNGSGLGSYTGPNATASVTLGGPLVERAEFAPGPFYTQWPFLVGVLGALIALVLLGLYRRRGQERTPPYLPPGPPLPPPPPPG